MILIQILKILPASSMFKILDEHKPVLEGMLSRYDKSIMFKTVDDDMKFQQIYSSFHVELIDKIDDVWIINVR